MGVEDLNIWPLTYGYNIYVGWVMSMLVYKFQLIYNILTYTQSIGNWSMIILKLSVVGLPIWA